MDMIRVGTSHYVSKAHAERAYYGDTDTMLAEDRITIGPPSYDSAKGERLVHDRAGRYFVLYPAG